MHPPAGVSGYYPIGVYYEVSGDMLPHVVYYAIDMRIQILKLCMHHGGGDTPM